MANKFATNFKIPSSVSVFQIIWKLTRVMKAAGWNTVSHSNGAAKTAAGTNNNDSWGNNADPLLDTYPAFDAAAPWIVMQGPSTLKIPISGNPSGTPLRGEKITQSATSFEGELLGFVWDSVGATGYMVVMPRVNTPNNATAIVGFTSGASFTPIGTIVTYQREVVFSKATAASLLLGDIYYVCADASAESTSLFSTLATSAGATATIPPGGGGTGNGFPTLGITIRGTGGTAATTAAWFGNVTSGYGSFAQIACANATPATNITGDGSFWTALPTTSYNQTTGFMFTRLDDQEPGDVDPYVWMTMQNGTFSTWSRTSFIGGSTGNAFTWTIANMSATTPCLVGYQARGITTDSRDVVAPFFGTSLNAGGQTGTYALSVTASPGIFRELSTTVQNPPWTRELMSVGCPGTTAGTFKQLKGRCRWIAFTSLGNTLDTFDNKTWFCVTTVNASAPAILLGPYDGVSTPVA